MTRIAVDGADSFFSGFPPVSAIVSTTTRASVRIHPRMKP